MFEMPLHFTGDVVELANLHKDELNGREGVLKSFDRLKQRWVVMLDGRPALFRSANLHLVSPAGKRLPSQMLYAGYTTHHIPPRPTARGIWVELNQAARA
eukprot:3727155-Amphidinium_carterae.2